MPSSQGAHPPDPVVRAFGVSEPEAPQPLAGALRQSAWRFGDVVLKRIEDPNPGEAEWVAAVLEAMRPNGFRIAAPVRARDGAWVWQGWTAWRWLDGDHADGSWDRVVEATDAFHEELRCAVARAGLAPRPSWLDTRDHRWARAERTVWHGAPLPPTCNTGEREWSMFRRAVQLGPPLTEGELAQCQVVHGDVAGNVLLDPAGTPGFIDVSPGWRTPKSSSVQTLVEAVAWRSAGVELLDGISRADAARACGFRLLCGLQVVADWGDAIPEEVAAWERVLDAIGA